MTSDEALMPLISSANIACGFHAGDRATMIRTIQLAKQHDVAIGAHVSFNDRENFGRTEMQLSPIEIYQLVTQQIHLLQELVNVHEAELSHVKPHGALYNMSAKNFMIADAITNAVYDTDKNLRFFGLANSTSIRSARSRGLRVVHEAFADRKYNDDGSLTSRIQPGSLIEDAKAAAQQALALATGRSIVSITGKELQVQATSICIHGDGAHALETATTIHSLLKQKGIEIKAC